MQPARTLRHRTGASVAVGLGGLLDNPLRTALSTLGVVIGVGALVSILAVGDGVERYAREQIERTTDLNFIAVQSRGTELMDGLRLPRRDTLRFGAAEAAALSAVVAPTAQVDLIAQATAVVSDPAGRSRGTVVTGLLADGPTRGRLRIVGGTFFSAGDVADRAHVIVASQRFADQLGARVGSTVTLRGTAWLVRGVVAGADTTRLEVYVPITAISDAKAAGTPDPLPMLAVRVARIEDAPVVRARIERWLADRFGDWHGRAEIVSNAARAQQAGQAMLIFKLLMGAIAGISLVVGGIGIMNVLLASVAERTREIGIRRSAGARRRDILLQFLAEAIAVTSAGSALGVALGLSVALAVTAYLRARTAAPLGVALTFPTFVIAVGTAIVVGVAFGLYPALRAAHIAPVDAIRHE